MKQEIHK